METNEAFENPGASPGVHLNLEAQTYLQEAGKWAAFLGVLGFIGTGIILLLALFVTTIFSYFARFQPTPYPYPAAFGGMVSFVYILFAVFNFFFALYLYQFGTRIKKGMLRNDEAETNRALAKLKSFFKLWGITTIVIIALYTLMIIVFIIVGIGTATMMHK